MGLFITLEGIEGSGKSTHVKLLSAALQNAGFELLITREPGATELGRALRSILLTPTPKPPVPEAELLLYLADRAQHAATMLRPALAEGRIVVCDRYIDSTIAYQGYGRGLNLDDLRRFNFLATGGLVPDLTLVLDLPVEVGLSRLAHRNAEAGPDRLEKEAIDFHERVRQGFLAESRRFPERVKIIDASRLVTEVAAEIRREVQARLPRDLES